MATKRPPRRQCAKCPWRAGVNPYEIPDGYDPELHRALRDTIADGPDISDLGRLRIMACHETEATPCVGWLAHQLGPGNNIPLRLAVSTGRIDGNVETIGPQHETFDDTLPEGET